MLLLRRENQRRDPEGVENAAPETEGMREHALEITAKFLLVYFLFVCLLLLFYSFVVLLLFPSSFIPISIILTVISFSHVPFFVTFPSLIFVLRVVYFS